jgi:hypothetical protein
MIAHVAQAGEDRGRVVLHLRSSRPSAIALEAAVRIARAFQSEIESVFVQDEQLMDCADYGFVRETSLTGRQQRRMTRDAVARDMHLASIGARRQIEALARRAEVPLRSRVVRDEPLRALSIACAETGPWNVVALAEPFSGGASGMLKQLLVEIAGATGLVLVGPQARRTTGPAIVAIEDIDHLPPMLKAGERLAALDGSEVILLLVASDEWTGSPIHRGSRRRAHRLGRGSPWRSRRDCRDAAAHAGRVRHRPIRRIGRSRRGQPAPSRRGAGVPAVPGAVKRRLGATGVTR